MIRGVELSQLKLMKDNIELVSDILDYCLKNWTPLPSFNSAADLDSKTQDSFINPDSYYDFKMFDSGVCIMRNRNKYVIKCLGFHPRCFRSKDFYDNEFKSYGSYETLPEAKTQFYFCVLDLIEQKTNLHLQDDLF